jgi:hypothetical protein
MKTQFVPYDMDRKSCHYNILLNSLLLDVIKLETYLSTLGKTLFLLSKPFGGGGSIRSVVSTLCSYLHGKCGHVVLNPVPILQNSPGASEQNRPFLTSHISGEEAPKFLKLIENNALF